MFKEFKLVTFSDKKGKLTPLELSDFFDFEVKRIYTVHENIEVRGGHAHILEEEFFMMTSGSCRCRLHDGNDWVEINLDANENGLYVGQMIWHEFDNFSDDGVLLALSSTNYNPNRLDYIENINEFLKNV
jgi:dTDP-4-dehydrorhamnose 3,5-epimerase-like enzyme